MELAIGAFLGICYMWVRGTIKKHSGKARFAEWDISNPENQYRFVQEAHIRPRNPINSEAYKAVYVVVERTIKSIKPRHRLLAEVSLGSFLGTTGRASEKAQKRAFNSFNSKRVDFLIIDTYGKPKLAIEYHGSGHYLSDDAEQRDAVKRLALERAGIPLLEFQYGVHANEVANKVRWWLTRNE